MDLFGEAEIRTDNSGLPLLADRSRTFERRGMPVH